MITYLHITMCSFNTLTFVINSPGQHLDIITHWRLMSTQPPQNFSILFGIQWFPLKYIHNKIATSLQWRHNDGVSNHQPHDCLLNRLFGRRSKKKSKLLVTSLCAGYWPVTGEFPAQIASNAEIVSIWWRHHVEIAAVVFMSQCATMPFYVFIPIVAMVWIFCRFDAYVEPIDMRCFHIGYAESE